MATPNTYDLFLSFRPTDVGKSFTSHLLSTLEQHGFRTFRDDNKLNRGEHIGGELQKAIEQSRVSLVILSENYAASQWCLDELLKIMDCKKRFGQIVFPIFHGVAPSDVRAQKGCLAEAFAKHAKYFTEDGRVEKWREALTNVADMSGLDLPKVANGDEARVVQEIVKEVLNKLNIVNHVASYEIGPESRLQEVVEKLKMEADDVLIFTIGGIGGIGKKSMAIKLCNGIQHKFEGSAFVASIRETSKQPNEKKNRGEALTSNDSSILGLEDLQQHCGDRGDAAAKTSGPGKSSEVLETLLTKEQPIDCVLLLAHARFVQQEKTPDLPRVLQINGVEPRVTKIPRYLGELTSQSASSSGWPIVLPDGGAFVLLDPLDQSRENMEHVARADKCSPTVFLAEKEMATLTLKRKCGMMSTVFEGNLQDFGRRCGSAAKSLGVSEPTFKRRCRELGIVSTNRTSTQPISIFSHMRHTSPGVVPPTPRQDTSSLKVRATYKDDTIQFRLPLTSAIAELKDKVAMRLALDPDSFELKYKEYDGELISIPCDEDLRTYLQRFSLLVNPIIRLFVVDLLEAITNLCESFRV